MAREHFSLKSQYVWLTVFFAIALQVQVSLFQSLDYVGLRLNLADFALPFCGIFILISLFLKKSEWPNWRRPFGYWALGGISLIIVTAALNGRYIIGEWSSWAIINKTLGWFILCAYCCAGAWIARNSREDVFKVFAYVFLSAFCVITLLNFIHFALYWEYNLRSLPHPGYYIEGFMYNRNAFAFLFLAAFIATIFLKPDRKHLKTMHCLFWLLVPLCFLLTGSRALWLCAPPLLTLAAAFYRTLSFKTIALCMALGMVSTILIVPQTIERAANPLKLTILIAKQGDAEQQYMDQKNMNKEYDNNRFGVIKESLLLYKSHPITGAGLGSVVHAQNEKYGKTISVLDNTLLWILTEMGALGLFGFLWVYIVMLRSLANGWNDDANSWFYKAAFCLLLAFGLFSQFHEILYSRFLWFILGMALVLNRAEGSTSHLHGQKI